MFNPFKLRKMIALLIVGSLPLIVYMFTEPFVALGQISFYVQIGICLISIFIFGLISIQLLKHPFSQVVEGDGMIMFDMNSTGVITPFIIGVRPGNVEISGKVGKHTAKGIFDRESVYQLAEPVNIKAPLKQDSEGNLTITMTNAEYHKSRMALYHRPALIYNSQIQSMITKDYLSNKEKNTFTEYGLLYLSRKVEELNTAMLNFGRYVVEMTKPKSDIFSNGWFWGILIVGLVIMGIIFLPHIIEAVKGGAQTVGSGVINPV